MMATKSITDMTDLMNFHLSRQKYRNYYDRGGSDLSGAAYSLRKYSTVKIMTQAVSRQKKDILYLSPQANT